jgi:hypothetical protein
MGCNQSDLRGGDEENPINREGVPEVPPGSWYAVPFDEPSPMPETPFHKQHKGKVLFGPRRFPTAPDDLALLPGGEPVVSHSPCIAGAQYLYGMAYLFNTALFVEHFWRTRVAHDPGAKDAMARCFGRPFYDTLVGVKVYLDDVLVPDAAPHKQSLPQCTSTYRCHEAVALWRAIPVPLLPDLDAFPLNCTDVYHGLALSVATAVAALPVREGEDEANTHALRVEVVYGAKSEGNFCTDFIARGADTLIVNAATAAALEPYIAELRRRVRLGGEEGVTRNVVLLPARMAQQLGDAHSCAQCHQSMRYACTVCGAPVCGTQRCVTRPVEGYPYGCLNHRPVSTR